MTKEEHHQIHIERHAALCELFWDFLKNSPGKKINADIHDLLRWSAKQVDQKPDHPAQIVTVRQGE
jgi:hypothetical protein